MDADHILVDGYSILHQWKELKVVLSRNLAAARQTLILLLTQFHDCHGGQLTLVFDGRSLPRGEEVIKTSICVLYSKTGETADAVIERMVGQSKQPSQFLVATDDHMERNVVEALGAQTISTEAFHAMVQANLNHLNDTLRQISHQNRPFSS